MRAFIQQDYIDYAPSTTKLLENGVAIDIITFLTSVTSNNGIFASVDINGGTIDGVTIGSSVMATGVSSNILDSYSSIRLRYSKFLVDFDTSGYTRLYMHRELSSTSGLLYMKYGDVSYINIARIMFGSNTASETDSAFEFNGKTYVRNSSVHFKSGSKFISSTFQCDCNDIYLRGTVDPHPTNPTTYRINDLVQWYYESVSYINSSKPYDQFLDTSADVKFNTIEATTQLIIPNVSNGVKVGGFFPPVTDAVGVKDHSGANITLNFRNGIFVGVF